MNDLIVNSGLFSQEQLKQIAMGQQMAVDVSVYAKPEYNYKQMAEIRTGLFYKLDVSLYANPAFTHNYMYWIRVSLKKGFDVTEPLAKGYKLERLIEWHNKQTAINFLNQLTDFQQRLR